MGVHSRSSSIMPTIELPNGFVPRDYQRAAMRYFDKGGTRGVYCWPRRSGKDLTFIHQAIKAAHERPGTYYHFLPSHTQARKVIWDNIDNDGRRTLDVAIPQILREATNETEMKIKLKCGALWQLVGADYFDSIMGTNPFGMVFSEAALTTPLAWPHFRPILAANGGWAAFISTPRGFNWFHELLLLAKDAPTWNWSHLNVNDTKHIPAEVLASEKREMADELYRQEYMTDFSASNIGAILGRYMEDAEYEGRIGEVEYDPEGAPVEISSDIGFRDTAAFWFWQPTTDGYALIDYDEDTGLDAGDWVERLRDRYPYGTIWLPHDAKAKTFATKRSALEQFLAARIAKSVHITPSLSKADRINAARVVLRKCHFNRTRCALGLNGLREWSYEYNDETRVFSKEPRHDWASHPGDSFSYGALVMQQRKIKAPKPEIELRGPMTIGEMVKASERAEPRRARI